MQLTNYTSPLFGARGSRPRRPSSNSALDRLRDNRDAALDREQARYEADEAAEEKLLRQSFDKKKAQLQKELPKRAITLSNGDTLSLYDALEVFAGVSPRRGGRKSGMNQPKQELFYGEFANDTEVQQAKKALETLEALGLVSTHRPNVRLAVGMNKPRTSMTQHGQWALAELKP